MLQSLIVISSKLRIRQNGGKYDIGRLHCCFQHVLLLLVIALICVLYRHAGGGGCVVVKSSGRHDDQMTSSSVADASNASSSHHRTSSRRHLVAIYSSYDARAAAQVNAVNYCEEPRLTLLILAHLITILSVIL